MGTGLASKLLNRIWRVHTWTSMWGLSLRLHPLRGKGTWGHASQENSQKLIITGVFATIFFTIYKKVPLKLMLVTQQFYCSQPNKYSTIPMQEKRFLQRVQQLNVHHKLVSMLIEQFKKMSIPTLQKVIGNWKIKQDLPVR